MRVLILGIIVLLALIAACRADQLVDPDPYCAMDSTTMTVTIDSSCIDVIGFLP